EVDLLGGAADPRDLGRIVLNAGGVHVGLGRYLPVDRADLGAVLGRGVVDVVGCLEAAGTGHGLDDDVRLAGNVARHDAGEEAGVGVVGALAAAVDGNRLAFVEVVGGEGRA